MFASAFDLISGRLYPYFWKYRHLWSRGWPESYLSEESVSQNHRKLVCDAVGSLQPFNSVLEYGCGPGANLFLLAMRFKYAKIYGVDISDVALKRGREFFKWIPNVSFHKRRPENTEIDVFVTDACLIYHKNVDGILDVIRILSRKGYVGCEWHSDCDESFTFGRHWVHNYRKLFPGCEITKLKWDVPDEGWDTFGHIITWKQTKEVTQHG